MKQMKMWLAVVALGALSAQAAEYELDASHSSVGFGVKHMVVSTTKGVFKDFTGSFAYDAAVEGSLAVQGSVRVASVDTGNAKRDDHLKNSDFLDVASHPEITFASTKFEGGVLYGNLTIKGITKEIVLPVELNGPIVDPWGVTRLGLEGRTKINRQDFGVTWSKTMDGGGLVVADDVTIDLVIEGTQKK